MLLFRLSSVSFPRGYISSISILVLFASLFLHEASSAVLPLEKRERVPNDALDPKKVIDWMIEVKIPQVDKLVFYTGEAGQEMASNFCKANPEFRYFWNIFNTKFVEDFGGPNMELDDFTLSCSKAMAKYAKGETRVFNHKNAKKGSYWLTWELPRLKHWYADYIFTMKDNTKDPADYDGDLVPDDTISENADQTNCHGVSGTVYVDNDAARKAITDFCGQGDSTRQYNAGTPNSMSISVTNTMDLSQPLSAAPACMDTLTAKLGNCDGNDPVNNPSNYKFGFEHITTEGWRYALTPKTTRIPANEDNTCDVSYKFWFDSFEIRGRNFDGNKLGPDGANLRKEIEGCGKITKWKFEQTPSDPTFSWFASGELPIGTKACVGRATISAGGSTVDDCHGSG